MISIEQIKAGRALLDWTQEELAHAAGLSKPSINTLERRIASPKMDTLNAIQRALETAGVEFTDGPGVKLTNAVLKTQIFEGSDALVRLCRDIFDTLVGTGKELIIAGIVEKNYNWNDERITAEVHRRHKHNIPTKLLSCEGDTHFVEPVSHYRWMSKAFFPIVPTYIYDNKYAMLLWGPPQKVVLIENAEIAESYRQQFLAHWANAKKPVVPKK